MTENKPDPERIQRMVNRAIALLSDPDEREQLRHEREALKKHTKKYEDACQIPWRLLHTPITR